MFQKIMALFSGKNQNDEFLKAEMILRIKKAIEKWNCNDIYAISLWVSDIDDEPWKPTFTLEDR